MSSYSLAKVRECPKGKDGFLIEYYFSEDSYSKYSSRLSAHFEIIEMARDESKGEFDEYENLEVYGIDQAREHRQELINTGKYTDKEIVIVKTDRVYLLK